jgi:hypothetical protein
MRKVNRIEMFYYIEITEAALHNKNGTQNSFVPTERE